MASKGKNGTAATRSNHAARGDARVAKRSLDPKAQMRVERLVELTMLGKDTAAIATELGVARSTVSNLRQRADYKARYDEARAEIQRLTTQRLVAMQGAAVAAHIRALSPEADMKHQLRAAESVFDRTGLPRQTKVEQTGEVTITPVVDMSPFEGRTTEEKRHYLAHGVFPDGTKPVAK